MLARNWLICVGAVLLFATGCGDSDSPAAVGDPAASVSAGPPPAAAAPAPSAGPGQTYAVFVADVPASGWVIGTVARAEDPATKDLLDEIEGVTWSAEYENPRDQSGSAPYLKVSGIERPLADIAFSEGAVENYGQIAGRPARWGTDPADPEGGTFVMIALSPQDTVLLEAFEVSDDELRRFAGDLRPATAREWLRAHRLPR